MDRSIPPLRSLLAIGLLLGVLAAAAALLLRQDARPPGAAPDAYRIVYDVTDLVTGTRSREVVEVDPPLSSRRVSGATGSATTGTGVFSKQDGAWQQVAVVPPGQVGEDVRLTSALEWAAEHGLASRDGMATVAGRSCTWWRTREPVEVASFAAATDDDSARTCVDAAGRLLADTWRAGGRDLRVRTATSVTALDQLDVLDGARPTPLAPELTFTTVVQLEGAVDDLVVLSVPEGMTLRAAARFTELEPGTAQPRARGARAVYSDRQHVLVVDQLRGELDLRGERVELGDLGTGFVQATAGGLVVQVPLGERQRLRVRTSLAYDDLARWLTMLRRS